MGISDKDLNGLSRRVGEWLFTTGQTLTVAESCTGGFIAKVLTDVAGSSAWFGEGFVTYGNEAKMKRLGVPSVVLRRHGAVSEETALAMARGALKATNATIAVAVTGIAGPTGAVPGKPVGTVWIAWARRSGRKVTTIAQRRLFRGDRDLVRRQSVRLALQRLLRQPP
jgi:nicotinamide-nucleotide amidase